MILNSKDIADRLIKYKNGDFDDPLVITPMPDLESLQANGSASLDLRLGTWFLTLKQERMRCIDIDNKNNVTQASSQFTKLHYVPFGGEFILHPRSFVLGISLEWIRLPKDLAAIVTGKSSWGRRGLIIATATGVHPVFSGCLTLEITNLGDIPIEISPGLKICQLFLHKLNSPVEAVAKGSFAMQRKPAFGFIKPDKFFNDLQTQ